MAKRVPWMLGGSADLAPSNNSRLTFEGTGDFEAGNYAGRNFHFGIREHVMTAVLNGMTLCNLRAYGATFFVFTDYMRPSIRLAAIMGLPALYILTHDSIGVGEDGPTHQPVEHLAALRRFRTWPCSVPATPTKWPNRTGPSCNSGRSPRRSCSRGRTCPRSTVASVRRPRACRRAAMC